MSHETTFRWWRGGDLDGFFGLFVDNLIQLLLIVTLCGGVLQMGPALLYGRILPGVAVSLLAGNLFYAFQARALARRTGNPRVTALPYGVNTVSLFAYVLFVMLPVARATNDPAAAWRAGLAACLGSGLIELTGAFVAGWVKRITPRAALLATLAGIALTFISMDFCFRIFADPLIGVAPLAIILLQYVGGLRLPRNVPAGLVAIVVGTGLAWGLGRMDGAALAAWGLLMLQSGLRGAGTALPLVGLDALAAQLPIRGMIALSQGFIFTSMVLAAMTVALVERRFRVAAGWAAAAAALAATGLIHGYRLTPAGITNAYGPATTYPFVAGYALAAACFVLLGWRHGANHSLRAG